MGAPAGDLNGSTSPYLIDGPIKWSLTIDQLGSLIVDSSVLEEFGHQARREHIRKVGILGGGVCRSLLANQAGYLRLPQRVDVKRGRAGRRIGTD